MPWTVLELKKSSVKLVILAYFCSVFKCIFRFRRRSIAFSFKYWITVGYLLFKQFNIVIIEKNPKSILPPTLLPLHKETVKNLKVGSCLWLWFFAYDWFKLLLLCEEIHLSVKVIGNHIYVAMSPHDHSNVCVYVCNQQCPDYQDFWSSEFLQHIHYIMQYIHAAAFLRAAMILLPARTITVLSRSTLVVLVLVTFGTKLGMLYVLIALAP